MTEKTEAVWRLEIHSSFYKKLVKLPRPEREAVLIALSRLQKDPFSMDFRPLRARIDWRLRVGSWRILIRMEENQRVMIAYDLGPRGDIYK